jgi:hypothetical protein
MPGDRGGLSLQGMEHGIRAQVRFALGMKRAQGRVEFVDGVEITELCVATLAVVHQIIGAGEAAEIPSIARSQAAMKAPPAIHD